MSQSSKSDEVLYVQITQEMNSVQQNAAKKSGVCLTTC